MENRNDKDQVQELDPEQMENVSGGLTRDEGLTCDQCGATFWSRAKLFAHIQEKHAVRESSIIP